MELVATYRRYAEDALEKARTASDPISKKEWLAIAEGWTALADTRLLFVEAQSAKDYGLI